MDDADFDLYPVVNVQPGCVRRKSTEYASSARMMTKKTIFPTVRERSPAFAMNEEYIKNILLCFHVYQKMLREHPAVVKLDLTRIALENSHIDAHVHVYREANVKIDVMAVTRGVPLETFRAGIEVFVAARGNETSRCANTSIVHEKQTQMIHVVSGEGLIETGERLRGEARVVTGSVIIIPRGTRHKIVNTGQSLLRFFTVYC